MIESFSTDLGNYVSKYVGGFSASAVTEEPMYYPEDDVEKRKEVN